MEELYKKIVNLCEIKGVSLAQMAKECGISKNIFTELKKGRTKTLSSKTLTKITEYFKVTADYLLGSSDEKEKSPVVSNEASEIDIQILNALKELSEEQKAQALDFALFLANNSKK